MNTFMTIAAIAAILYAGWRIIKRDDDNDAPTLTPIPSATPNSTPSPTVGNTLTVKKNNSEAIYITTCTNHDNNIPRLSASFEIEGGSGNYEVRELNSDNTRMFPEANVQKSVSANGVIISSFGLEYTGCPRESGYQFFNQEFEIEDVDSGNKIRTTLELSWEIV